MLEGSRHKDAGEATSVIREFWQTSRCDDVCANFRDHRAAIRDHLGGAAMDRILNYQANDTDREKAVDTVAHCRWWTTKLLVAALPPASRLYYHLIFKSERGLLALTGLGMSGGMAAWLRKQHKLLARRSKA